MTEVTIHRLARKDLSTMTGDCTVCGFVAIARAGNGFQCGVKKKASHRAWRERNPVKAAANRRRRSEHELFDRDYVALSAKCSVCGPTDLVVWGRGYICGGRGRELRSVQESKRQAPCRECWIIDGDRVFPVGGVCPRCADQSLYDTSRALRSVGRSRGGLERGFEEAGFSVRHAASSDDYDDDRQPAVPGWKTIGSDRPWYEV